MRSSFRVASLCGPCAFCTYVVWGAWCACHLCLMRMLCGVGCLMRMSSTSHIISYHLYYTNSINHRNTRPAWMGKELTVGCCALLVAALCSPCAYTYVMRCAWCACPVQYTNSIHHRNTANSRKEERAYCLSLDSVAHVHVGMRCGAHDAHLHCTNSMNHRYNINIISTKEAGAHWSSHHCVITVPNTTFGYDSEFLVLEKHAYFGA